MRPKTESWIVKSRNAGIPCIMNMALTYTLDRLFLGSVSLTCRLVDIKTIADNWVSKESWLFWYWSQFTLGLACFLGIVKLFGFSRYKTETFCICLKIAFVKSYKISTRTTDRENENKNCLNELICGEVSRNFFLNRCWKFQLSILKTKKFYSFKKYNLSHSL